MKRTVLLPIAGLLSVAGVLACWFGIRHHHRQEASSQREIIPNATKAFGPQGVVVDAKEACKQRGVLLDEIVQRLEKSAKAQLRIGSGKDSVIRFLNENGFKPEYIQNEIQGEVIVTGCAPPGCGTDDVLVGVRVEVNGQGTVVSEPVVVTMYTSCA